MKLLPLFFLASLIACDDSASSSEAVDGAVDGEIALDLSVCDGPLGPDAVLPDAQSPDGPLPDVPGPDAAPPDPFAPCPITPSPRTGLRVEGCTFIREDGAGVTPPRGIVVSGDSLARASRTPFHEAVHYTELAEHYDLVWLLVTWDGIEPRPDTYNGAYLGRICEQVGWANDAGLDVVLAMQFDRFGYGVGGAGAPAWVGAGDPLPDTATPADAADLWGTFWSNREQVVAFEAAWARLIDTCSGGTQILGLQVMTAPGGDATATYAALVQRVRDLAEAAFAQPVILFYEPLWEGAEHGFPAGPDVVFSPSARLPALTDWRALANEHAVPLFIRDSPVSRLDRAESLGASWAVWHDGFGTGPDALRNEDGEVLPAGEAVASKPHPVQVAGRIVAFGGDPWILRWRADGRNAGLSRVQTGGRVPLNVELTPNGPFDWFSDFDAATGILTVFVEGAVGAVELAVEWTP